MRRLIDCGVIQRLTYVLQLTPYLASEMKHRGGMFGLYSMHYGVLDTLLVEGNASSSLPFFTGTCAGFRSRCTSLDWSVFMKVSYYGHVSNCSSPYPNLPTATLPYLAINPNPRLRSFPRAKALGLLLPR